MKQQINTIREVLPAANNGCFEDRDKILAALSKLESELKQWKNVFGHLGTADECGNEWIRLQDENQRLREALESLAERFSNMDASGDKWISTVAAAAMTLHVLEKQP